MNYFTILGLTFGTIAFLKPVYMHVIPYDENKFIAKAYSTKRPAWIVPVAVTGLILVLFTWYVELTTDYAYSLVLTILFSLTAVKGIVLLFDYEKFQNWVTKMLHKSGGRDIILIDIGASIFGLIMIILTLIIF